MTKTPYSTPAFFKLLTLLQKLTPFRKPAPKAEDLILEDDPIYLIASGYEWTCPRCQRLHREIEITQQVACPHCRRAYPVAEADHAWQ